jgi:hypothetical protein
MKFWRTNHLLTFLILPLHTVHNDDNNQIEDSNDDNISKSLSRRHMEWQSCQVHRKLLVSFFQNVPVETSCKKATTLYLNHLRKKTLNLKLVKLKLIQREEGFAESKDGFVCLPFSSSSSSYIGRVARVTVCLVPDGERIMMSFPRRRGTITRQAPMIYEVFNRFPRYIFFSEIFIERLITC